MTSLELVSLFLVPLLALAGFGLSMIDAAYTRVGPARAEALGDDESDNVTGLVDNRVASLAPVWLSLTFVLVIIVSLVALIADRRWGSWGVVIAIAIVAPILFAGLWLVPRARAFGSLDTTVLRSASVVRRMNAFAPLSLITAPVVALLSRRRAGESDPPTPTPVSEGELLAFAGQAREDAAIELEEQHLIELVIEFGDTRVSDVMVPRPDMITLRHDQSVEDGLQSVVAHGFSRFPVIGEHDESSQGIDHIIGIVHAKDMVAAQLQGRGHLPVTGLMRGLTHVPQMKHISKLQREMQDAKFHMAVVVDEYGGTAGVVTLEDIIEELVGEIVDEFDVEEPMIELLADGGARVNGKVSLTHVDDMLGERIHQSESDGEYSTVGGLIFSTLGHVPNMGEVVELDDYRLLVERVRGSRIARVHLSRTDGVRIGLRERSS